MIDTLDMEILEQLANNSRLQWKEIGEQVHLTGQAVAARVRRMEDIGLIEGYTLKINPEKLGQPITALITVFMKSTDHGSFCDFLKRTKEVTEAHRISGDGCYWLQVLTTSQEDLNKVLDEILRYGNYRVNLSIGKIK